MEAKAINVPLKWYEIDNLIILLRVMKCAENIDKKIIMDLEEHLCKYSLMAKEGNFKPSIEIKNIDLTGLSLVDELVKKDEEDKEFMDALIMYLYSPNEITKEHLLEELCDLKQVRLSIMKIIGIDVDEIAEYWNTKHLEKIKYRPRHKGE